MSWVAPTPGYCLERVDLVIPLVVPWSGDGLWTWFSDNDHETVYSPVLCGKLVGMWYVLSCYEGCMW